MPETTLAITPDTRLADLWDAYPQTEELLIEAIPTLARLRTPALRNSVGRTLSLEQAATASGTNLPQLVLRLRQLTGQPEKAAAPAAGLAKAPDWVKTGSITQTFDARPMLAQGQHPKTIITKELGSLSPGQVFVLLTPFVPGPLIEIGRSMGLSTWTRQGEAGRFETYFGNAG